MIVDEDAQSRNFILEILKPLSYDMVTANNGNEGVLAFKASQPLLVIIDLQIPITDGLEFIKAMRSINSAVPIIAVSGAALMLPDALSFGASITLAKPFSIDEMFALAKDYLK